MAGWKTEEAREAVVRALVQARKEMHDMEICGCHSCTTRLKELRESWDHWLNGQPQAQEVKLLAAPKEASHVGGS